MSNKAIFLTLLLTIGFSFQHCTKDKDPFGCGCDGIKAYFNIQGLSVFNTYTSGKPIPDNQELRLVHRTALLINFDYKLVSQKRNNRLWDFNFSLMNSCYACSCAEPGMSGSKKEHWKSFNIITLYDFNEKYKANDTINNIIYLSNYEDNDLWKLWNTKDAQPKVQKYSYLLGLKKIPPQTNTKFKAKVVVELTNGEVYEAETNTIIFK